MVKKLIILGLILAALLVSSCQTGHKRITPKTFGIGIYEGPAL